MDEDRLILRTAAELAEAGEEFVLITVTRTQGSTPRAAGTKMIWRPHPADAPARESAALPNSSFGTIGGGQFEHLVLEAARECLRKRTHLTERFVLGAEAEQCCGGVMEVFLEYHGSPARVVIFGAGHVAQSLSQILAPTPLAVSIVDDRPEWNSAERYPGAQRITDWSQGIDAATSQPESTLALVMTCSHDTDFKILRGLLRETLPAFTGLIGSKSKRACLFGRLIAAGIDESLVRRVRCPIGVGDTGKEPHAVAISVAAQLLLEARALSRTALPADARSAKA
ncbi:MAG: xanthine dehydrogenase accessory protein XdhC [Phycisphaeraceae bacterium]|nr:xanthine dehydrogenase accessory protein XdhC [Phycisphaeraceae bacterium]